MADVSLGDLAQTRFLQRSNAALKTQLQALATEVSSGQSADPGKALGGDFSVAAGLAHSLAILQSHDTAAAQAALAAETMQASLTRIDGIATQLATTLITSGGAGEPTGLATVTAQARDALSAAVMALNVQVGGRSLFSGTAAGHAVAPADQILAALAPVVAGQTSAAGVAAAVRDWFASPAGFAASAYGGGTTPPTPIPVAPGETASLGVTALDPALTETLAGLATAALLAGGPLSDRAPEQAALASIAGQALLSAQAGRTTLAAGLGVVQAGIAAAQSRNRAETSALQIAQAKLLEVDPYKAATDLQAVQGQLETLYALTARISSLSLTNFLR